MVAPLASLIVTTKNESAVLERLLKSIKQQTYKHIELIVVDNRSTDNTLAIAKKYTKSVYTQGPERSSQRNFGAKKAKGQYLFFLDADMELSPTVVEECVEQIKKSTKIGAVTVPEYSIAKTFWEKVKGHERSFYNKEGDPTTDAARFFSQEAFKKVGGYDESITGPEDWDLPENVKRLGFNSSRIKSVIYHHERIPSPWQLAKKKYYYALTSHRYLKKHDISPLSAKTIYFLRPVFYKNWKHLLGHPLLSSAMFLMFSFELTGGGLGFLVGKAKKL
jgi:glycosyltransferase involved in cell wall biosynthesis